MCVDKFITYIFNKLIMIIMIHILLYMYIRIKGQGRRGRDHAYRSWI
jgi:hypothetical protein